MASGNALRCAREEGRREGLREAATVIEERLKPPSDHFQKNPPADLATRLASALHEVRTLAAGSAQQRLDGGEDERGKSQELSWRAGWVLQAHLTAREKFFKEERGIYQAPSPAALTEATKEIKAALVRHGETNGDRERWRKESAVLAAGIGILYSEPHNGELDRKQRRLSLTELPKLYLELWRPWKLQRGKPDPVPGFAEKCFARRRESDGR